MESKKSLVALVLVALIGIVGGTFAYFTNTAIVNNSFETGTYATTVKELFVSPDNWTPGTTTPKTINVTNKGSVPVAARISYTETWTAKDGTILSGERNGEKIAQFTIDSNWNEGRDGYYYYIENLDTNETSTDFISSVTFNPNFELIVGTDISCTTTEVNGKITNTCASLDSGYAGATYTLNITVETIQADQKWVYTPVNIVYKTGDVITIANEQFNVISSDDETVTMLAAKCLNSSYRQSDSYSQVEFSNHNDWGQAGDLDIQLYDGPAKTYINNYVTYLRGETGDTNLSGTLITKNQLASLDCDAIKCTDIEHASWLLTSQVWWTSTAYDFMQVYIVNLSGIWSGYLFDDLKGVRPVITISKSALENL